MLDRAIEGGVLSQIQDGVERVVGYRSHVLGASQHTYCVAWKVIGVVIISVLSGITY